MTNANEMAYPCQNRWDGGSESMDLYPDSMGLTKREYFAAAVLQGLLSNGEVTNGTSTHELIIEAVKTAESFIAALNGPICDECKCPLSDGHYDAEHDICSIAESASQ